MKPEYIKTNEEMKRQEQVDFLFGFFDSDGNGELDVDELVSLFEESGIPVSKKQLTSIFRVVDQDHSGLISKQEFLSVAIHPQC